jgi:hypothetical protein
VEVAKEKNYVLSALVRKEEQVERLKGQGVRGILFESLDDEDVVFKAASESDGE